MIKNIRNIGKVHLVFAYLTILIHSFVPHHHHVADRSIHLSNHDCSKEATDTKHHAPSLPEHDNSCSLLKETVSTYVKYIKWQPLFDNTRDLAYFDALQSIRFDAGIHIDPVVTVGFDYTLFELRGLETCGLRGPPHLT